jgi:transcriptional regulator with XRE-family HTH domain/superfamily II DNA or RNA helicase
MPNEAAEFTEREFLEVATRSARKIGRSEDPQDILLRYALDYTEDPEETVNTVIGLLIGEDREYPREAIEEFLGTNAETHAASLAAKIAPASSTAQAASTEPARESQGQSQASFPPGWSAGRIINHLRSRDQFGQLEECRQLLEDAAFLRSVRMLPPQRVSAHLLARLLNITPANVDGIEKGTIPVSPEICDSLIEIFGFHERAAEEFRSRAGIEKTPRTPGASTTAAALEPGPTLFATPLFVQMRDSLRDLLATDGPVYMDDGVTQLWPTQRELLEQCSGFLYTPVGEQIPGVEGQQIKRGQFMEALSATGTGKTDAYARLATAMNHGIRTPVLIITPRRLLNAQTKERFCQMHGVDEREIMIWDSNQPVRERTRLFQQNPPPRYTIVSDQSLFNLINEHQIDFTTPGSRYYRPLVIVDEVAEAIGSETGNLIRETFIDKVLVLGIAAADAGAAAALFRGQAPIYKLDIAEGIERDVLCNKLETRIIDVPLEDDTESADMLARMRAVGEDEEYDPFDTGMFARNKRVINAAVDFHLGYYHEDVGCVRDRPTVFFIDGINAAAQGARIFNGRARELGLAARAAYVSSEESFFVDYDEAGNVTRMEKRPAEILRMLDAGEIQAVWNDRLVGIGIDIPNLAVCYHVGHPHSLYRLLQEMGRITRKGAGNKTALAFNVCASGADPYLYEDVLGGTEVESRERQEKEERRVSRSPSGASSREDIPYIQVPDVRVYASRADRQTDSPAQLPQQGMHQLERKRSEISVRAHDAAAAQEQSMAAERQQVIADAEQQLRQRVLSDAETRLDSGNYDSLGEFLKLLRDEEGLSLERTADKVGVSWQSIGKYERGTVPGDLDALERGYTSLSPCREEAIHAQFALAKRRQEEARRKTSEGRRESMLARYRKSPDEMAAARGRLDSEDYSSFGAFLALLRDEQGLSLEIVATRVGGTSGAISNYEHGIFASDLDALGEGYIRLSPHREEAIRTQVAVAKQKRDEAWRRKAEDSRERNIKQKNPEEMAAAGARLDSGDYSLLGEFLTLLRHEQGLTLKATAEISGVKPPSIHQYEHGTIPRDFDSLEAGYIRLSPQREEAVRTQVAAAKRKKEERDAAAAQERVQKHSMARERQQAIADAKQQRRQTAVRAAAGESILQTITIPDFCAQLVNYTGLPQTILSETIGLDRTYLIKIIKGDLGIGGAGQEAILNYLQVQHPQLVDHFNSLVDVLEKRREEEGRRKMEAARTAIWETRRIRDFCAQLPDYTGLQLKTLSTDMGYSPAYLGKIIRGDRSIGTGAQKTLLNYLQAHHPELVNHFNSLTKNSDRNPGSPSKFSAAIATVATAATLPFGSAGAHSPQAPLRHVLTVQTLPKGDIPNPLPVTPASMTGTDINKAWRIAERARLTIHTAQLAAGGNSPTSLPSSITCGSDIPKDNLQPPDNSAVSGVNHSNVPLSSISDVPAHSVFVPSPKPIPDSKRHL